MHQQIDITLKDIIKDVPVKFLELLTGFESGKFLDAQFPDVRMRLPDLIIETPESRLVHLEIQSKNEEMLGRMYLYSGLIFNQHKVMPHQILLYVGNAPARMETIIRSGDNVFSYKLIDIRDIECSRLIDSDKPEDIVLAILCRSDNADVTIRKILDKLYVLPPRERDDYIRKLLILSDLRKLYNKVNEEVKKMPITIDLEESEMLQDVLREGQRRGELRGERKGLTEGIELGLEIKYGDKGLELMALVRDVFGNDETTVKLEEFKELIKKSGSVDELRAFLESR